MDNNTLAEGERDAAIMADIVFKLVLMLHFLSVAFYCWFNHFPAEGFIERACTERVFLFL